MAKLHFKYGAMDSGKTAVITQTAHNYTRKGMKPIVLKPSVDDREGKVSKVISRIGTEWNATLVDVNNKDEHKQLMFDIVSAGYNVIIVDEVQFFTPEFCAMLGDVVDEFDIPVLCYGLRNSFNATCPDDPQGGGFPASDWLLRHADKVEEIKTICYCGKKATHNMLVIEGKVIRKLESAVLVGGDDIYHSVCRKCFKAGNYK